MRRSVGHGLRPLRVLLTWTARSTHGVGDMEILMVAGCGGSQFGCTGPDGTRFSVNLFTYQLGSRDRHIDWSISSKQG